jgi:hypothetical protein
LKEEALDCIKWRNHFGRGCGPVVWQITDEWMLSFLLQNTLTGFYLNNLTWTKLSAQLVIEKYKINA